MKETSTTHSRPTTTTKFGLTTGQRISAAHQVAFEAIRDMCGGDYILRLHTQALSRAMTIEDAQAAIVALSKAADLEYFGFSRSTYSDFQKRLVEAEDFLY